MTKVSKKRKEVMSKLDLTKKYDVKEAIKLLKENSITKFNETLDVAINIAIDTKKTDQNVRGVIDLPYGTGKKVIVAVIAKGDSAKDAKKIPAPESQSGGYVKDQK